MGRGVSVAVDVDVGVGTVDPILTENAIVGLEAVRLCSSTYVSSPPLVLESGTVERP